MYADSLLLRGCVPAGRAVQRIVPDPLVPRRETGADPWLGTMDPAVGLPVISTEEERAVPDLPALYRDPVVNAGDVREIFNRNIQPVLFCPVNEPDAYMLQDILSALRDPRDDVLDDPLLPPAPLLAAPSALLAVLGRGHDGHSMIIHRMRWQPFVPD